MIMQVLVVGVAGLAIAAGDGVSLS